MIDRIRELMELKGLTSTQFADSVEVPRAVISHILSGRNKPSLEVITKIVTAFPDVSIKWMLLGEGKMLKPLVATNAPENQSKEIRKDPETEEKTVAERPSEPAKVQLDSARPVGTTPKDQAEKSIEQIVIFYSDKTFNAYKP